jgi:hypothetical protein
VPESVPRCPILLREVAKSWSIDTAEGKAEKACDGEAYGSTQRLIPPVISIPTATCGSAAAPAQV